MRVAMFLAALGGALLVAQPARADEPVALVLSVPTKDVFAGVPVDAVLSLQGPRVRQVVAATPGLLEGAFFPPSDAFTLRMSVRPAAPGPLVLGPYEIEAFGRKLTSNTLILDVRPQPQAGVRISASAATVAVGDTVRILVEGSPASASGVGLAPSPAFDVVDTSTSTTLETKAGVSTASATRTFVVRVKQEGALRFDRATLTGLPDNATVEGASVRVR